MAWTPKSLLSLPVELLSELFAYLDVDTLLSCASTCKVCRNVILDSSRNQYTIELARRRMVPSSGDHVWGSFSQRLTDLRARERGWRSLAWNKRHRLPVPHTGQVYEFLGGLYGNGKEGGSKKTSAISFHELGRPDLPPWTHSMEDLEIIDFTMDPSQDLLILVTMAPQDSKYVYNLHLRTLSTNVPHPKSAQAILPCFRQRYNPGIPPTDSAGTVRLQISGEILAFLMKGMPEDGCGQLQLWNWQTPKNHYLVGDGDSMDDFAILSHDVLLVVSGTGRFDVYTFHNPKHSTEKPVLRATFCLPALSSSHTYWYLSLSGNPSPGYSAKPHRRPDGDIASAKVSPYGSSTEDRVLACCLYAYEASALTHEHAVFTYVFFVNVKVFLDAARRTVGFMPRPAKTTIRMMSGETFSEARGPPAPEPAAANIASFIYYLHHNINNTNAAPFLPLPPSPPPPPPSSADYPPFSSFSTSPSSEVTLASQSLLSGMLPPTFSPRPNPLKPPTYIEWESWGPQNTRWFVESLNTDWQHAVHGLRAVDSISLDNSSETDAVLHFMQGNPAPKKFLRVRDFNPWNVFEAREGKRIRVVTESTTIPSRGVFTKDIVSMLPYAEMVSEELVEVTDVMLDEERVLVLRRGMDGKLETIDVLCM